MLLNTRKLSFLGLLLAMVEVLIVLSGVIEFNTMFFLAGASFCVGIAIRESGKRIGLGFYLASILLSLILAPNKLYCITYAAFGLYLLMIEFSFDQLIHIKNQKSRKVVFWIIKYAVFNLMYIPMLIFLPALIYPGELNTKLFLLLLLAGQAALLVFDFTYEYFQRLVWGKIRGKLKL